MRKIYEDRKDVLMTAIDIATAKTIQILQDRYGNWQIGWTKSRYVDPRDAEHFADMINGAVDVANMLTRQQIRFVETDGLDPEIDSDERFDEVVKYVTEWFEEGEYRKIEAWIIAGDIETLPPEVEEAVVEAVAEEIETPLALDPENVDEVVQEAIEVAEGTKAAPEKFLKLYDEDGEVRGYKLGDHYLMKVYGWSGYSWVINKDGRRHYSSVDYSNALANHEIESVSSCKAGKARLKELAGVKEPEAQIPMMNIPRYCGGKEQEKMIDRGWKLKIAEDPRETPREIFDRLIQSYDRVKIYYDTTRVRGLHSYFAMVK